MKTLVIYDTQFGNTERIAQAVAKALATSGQSRAERVASGNRPQLEGVDLLIVGSPTVGWRQTPAMRSLLQGLAPGSLRGLAAASFDTCMRLPGFLRGSAAKPMAAQLEAAGAILLAQPQTFWVKGRQGPLEAGEVERAATWADTLARAWKASHPESA